VCEKKRGKEKREGKFQKKISTINKTIPFFSLSVFFNSIIDYSQEVPLHSLTIVEIDLGYHQW